MLAELILVIILLCFIGFGAYVLYIDVTRWSGKDAPSLASSSVARSAPVSVTVTPPAVASSTRSSESRRSVSSSTSSSASGKKHDFRPATVEGTIGDYQVKDLVAQMRDSTKGLPLKTRYYNLKKRDHCFTGAEAVDWFVAALQLKSREDALLYGEKLLMRGIIHNVSRLYPFADRRELLYRFSKPSHDELPLPDARFADFAEQMRAGISKSEKKYRNRSWPSAFHGSDAITWVQKALNLSSRDMAMKITSEIMERGAFHHVTFSESLQDKPIPYRFFKDDVDWLEAVSGTGHINMAKLNADVARLTEQTWDDARDWKLLAPAPKYVKYSKDDAVLEEGSFNRYLYRVNRGSVRVEKKLPTGKRLTLATLDVGKSFGEMSVLDPMGTVSAGIFANDEVDLIVIELSWLDKLFQTEPTLAERWYKHLATKLARRLQQAGSSKKDETTGSNNSSKNQNELLEVRPTAKPHQATDQHSVFQQLFGLSPDDLVYKEFPAKYKHKVLYSGTLYLSQRYVCFYAKVFGFKMKLTVVLASITGIEQHVDSKDKDRESEIRITVKRHHDKTDLKSSTKDVEKADKKEKHEKSYVLRFANKATMEEAYSVLDSVWRTHQPEEPTERKKSLVESAGAEADALNKDDWDSILRDAKLIKFKRDEIIISEGDYFQRIFQLSAGRCRAEKRGVVLGYIDQHETFGEISFLQGEGATVSVIADDDNVEVYVIEGFNIAKLFDSHPGIAARFYKYVAVVLNNRIRAREDAASSKQ